MPYKNIEDRRKRHREYRKARRAAGLEPARPPRTAHELEVEKRWREANREKLAANCAAWRKKNPDAYRTIMRRHKLKRYGLTLEQFEKMLADQNGVCAICKTGTASLLGNVLSIDHDHTTGKTRGLVCGNCNTVLGHCNDSIVILESAIIYLRKHASL